jgi:hypothetical protein
MRATALALLTAFGFVAAAANAQGQPAGTAPDQQANYAVGGRALGSRLDFDRALRDYKCAPSEQFSSFTWCQRTSRQREQRGAFEATYSILHAKDGTVVYVNRHQQPAFLSKTEAEHDIRRYTRLFGESPKISKMPRQFGAPEATIATWGGIELEPLDDDSIKLLAEGKSPKKGFLLDYLGNLNRSAQDGLPIYRIQGSAGFAWAANLDPNGRATLRLIAVDVSAFQPRAATTTQPAIQTRKGDEPKAAEELAREHEPGRGIKGSRDADSTVARLQSELSLARQEKAQAEETARLARTDAEIAAKKMEEARNAADAAFEEIDRLKLGVVAPSSYLDRNNAVPIGVAAAAFLIVGVWLGFRASRSSTTQLTNGDWDIRQDHVERTSPPSAANQSGIDQDGLVRELGRQLGLEEPRPPPAADSHPDNNLEPVVSEPEHAAPPIAAAIPSEHGPEGNREPDSAISMVQSTVYRPSHDALSYPMNGSVLVQCSISPPHVLLARTQLQDPA